MSSRVGPRPSSAEARERLAGVDATIRMLLRALVKGLQGRGSHDGDEKEGEDY